MTTTRRVIAVVSTVAAVACIIGGIWVAALTSAGPRVFVAALATAFVLGLVASWAWGAKDTTS